MLPSYSLAVGKCVKIRVIHGLIQSLLPYLQDETITSTNHTSFVGGEEDVDRKDNVDDGVEDEGNVPSIRGTSSPRPSFGATANATAGGPPHGDGTAEAGSGSEKEARIVGTKEVVESSTHFPLPQNDNDTSVTTTEEDYDAGLEIKVMVQNDNGTSLMTPEEDYEEGLENTVMVQNDNDGTSPIGETEEDYEEGLEIKVMVQNDNGTSFMTPEEDYEEGLENTVMVQNDNDTSLMTPEEDYEEGLEIKMDQNDNDGTSPIGETEEDQLMRPPIEEEANNSTNSTSMTWTTTERSSTTMKSSALSRRLNLTLDIIWGWVILVAIVVVVSVVTVWLCSFLKHKNRVQAVNLRSRDIEMNTMKKK